MLRIVSGPFQPVLDRTLVEDLRSCKADDPFAPLAVIVPSATLTERLKRLLAIEGRCSLLNVGVLTFHQLALRLRDDQARSADSGPAIPLALVDDFYFEQLIRQVVRQNLHGLEPLARLPESPGVWKGLWATVRDLKDAAVDPTVAVNALTEGLFEEEDRRWLETLFTLYPAVLEASRLLGVGSPDDLASSLGQALSSSTFLGRLRRLFYYGFYDLSQVQLSFFEAVARATPTTLYFPLEPSPPYEFARRFFERHLLPLAETHENRAGEASSSHAPIELIVFNVIGAEEELATACREILTLVEVNGYRFDEIGVVARSLEPYQARLQSVFDRHLVPFTSTAGRPLVRDPLVKTLLQLVSLPSNDFDRAAVLDVLAAPFYRLEESSGPSTTPRPDLWRIACSTLGITKGEAEWARLSAPSVFTILQEARGDLDGEARAGGKTVEPGQLTLLRTLVSRLISDCRALPPRGSVGRLTEAFQALVQRHFVIPGWTEPNPSTSAEPPRLRLVGEMVRASLARLLQLDPLNVELSWEEWTELFRLALEDTTIPFEEDDHRGVQVLDAMTARGLAFRALFVIGVNDKLFPRYVREDPFLRDRQRVALESTLGYKIDEKLAGHEEERLLFELLCQAATHRLYLSYQRADEAGRVMAPSAFVATALRDPRFVAKREETVHRRLTARISAKPAIQDVLPAPDLALGLLLQGQDARPVLDGIGKDRRLFEQGLAMIRTLERQSTELGSFDGLLNPRTPGLPMLDRQAVSPTSLERYATCPFRYFAEKVLRLEPVRQIEEDHLPAMTLGTLVHESLRLSYTRLVALQWPDSIVSEATVRSTVSAAVTHAFASHAATQGTGHALLWMLASEQVVELVMAAVMADQEEYRASGFRPYAFEQEAEGTVSLGSAAAPTELKVRGQLDRVDVREDPPALRIVDYKFKQGGEMKQKDRNLPLAAVRGFNLQPPFYASMGLPSLPPPSEVHFLFMAPKWEKPIARSIFEASVLLRSTGESIRQTIRTLVEGIERGEFFILPDGYCDHCDFPVACRRNDTMTWWRSYRSPQARVLRRLRKQKVADE
jgi:ATP-dependent helicase/nuclease subunit B